MILIVNFFISNKIHVLTKIQKLFMKTVIQKILYIIRFQNNYCILETSYIHANRSKSGHVLQLSLLTLLQLHQSQVQFRARYWKRAHTQKMRSPYISYTFLISICPSFITQEFIKILVNSISWRLFFKFQCMWLYYISGRYIYC